MDRNFFQLELCCYPKSSEQCFYRGSVKDGTSCLAGVNSVTKSASSWALIEIFAPIDDFVLSSFDDPK